MSKKQPAAKPRYVIDGARQAAFDTLKKIYRTQAGIGAVVNVSQQAVGRWFTGLSEMEYWRAHLFEQKTGGQVKATDLCSKTAAIEALRD